MDKFDRIMQQMSQMNEEQRMKTVKERKKICICNGCPTYNECAKERNELLFCNLGKSSKCITRESGCICPACPLTEDMGLKNEYFCTRGSEDEQRAK